jgi:hypothetical protein
MKFQTALVVFIFASLLFFYGGISVYVERGGLKVGKLGSLVKDINETSYGGSHAILSIVEGRSMNPQLIKPPLDSKTVNKLDRSIYTLLVTKDVSNPKLVLYNLKDSTIERSIDFPLPLSPTSDRVFLSSNYDNVIVGMVNDNKKFFVLKNGEFKVFESIYTLHHRIALVNDSLIYVNIARNIPSRKKFFDTTDSIRDEGYAIYNLEGQLLNSIFLLDMLPNVNMSSHDDLPGTRIGDPLHVNDVEVVPLSYGSTGPIQGGDVFLSLRHVGIVQIRNNKILKTFTSHRLGYQHDVDIVDSKTISASNNASKGVKYGLGDPASELVHIDVQTGLVDNVYKIPYFSTHTEGQITKLEDYTVVENQNRHELLIFKESQLIYKGGINVSKDDFRDLLNWQTVSLTYNSIDFLK